MAVWRLITHHDDPEYALTWSRRNERIALGWGAVGDVSKRYSSRQQIAATVQELFPERNNSVEGGHCLWDFCYEFRLGDRVILSTGKKRELVVSS